MLMSKSYAWQTFTKYQGGGGGRRLTTKIGDRNLSSLNLVIVVFNL